MNPRNYKKDDDYATPRSAWKNIIHLLPKNKIYYEPFFLKNRGQNEGSSGDILRELGIDVIHEDTDFFETVDQLEFDIIISNPPFSKKKEVLNKLFEVGKPFVMIMPVSVVCNKSYQRFIDEGSIGVPTSRIQFVKDGQQTKNCPFDSFYYFWKFGLPKKLFKISERSTEEEESEGETTE